ncbi:hypothetical protein CXB51_007580 [Gossypium anomalum]|uniref:Uncharacterized protein n=1 Tax=Gossypium anomalum TaxID=47600 RepID=A0A8J5ZRC0_9ROSI|nr:hypothetical protein CXB51_007580 [Gossypium anomalum]
MNGNTLQNERPLEGHTLPAINQEVSRSLTLRLNHLSRRKDHWLLGSSNCNIQYLNVRVDITQVSKLIDVHTRTWNEELIRSVFTSQEANRIPCIPLAQIRCNDRVVWRGKRTSEYTMMSGCKLLIKDHWLLGSSNCNIQYLNVRVDITQVSKLIDVHTRTWNEELIRSVFTSQEANRILCIPLAQIRCNDKVVWRGKRTSEYTMMSGCKLLIKDVVLQADFTQVTGRGSMDSALSKIAKAFDASSFKAFALSCAIQKALDKGFSGVVLEPDYGNDLLDFGLGCSNFIH